MQHGTLTPAKSVILMVRLQDEPAGERANGQHNSASAILSGSLFSFVQMPATTGGRHLYESYQYDNANQTAESFRPRDRVGWNHQKIATSPQHT